MCDFWDMLHSIAHTYPTFILHSILDYWDGICSPTADVSWALLALSAHI